MYPGHPNIGPFEEHRPKSWPVPVPWRFGTKKTSVWTGNVRSSRFHRKGEVRNIDSTQTVPWEKKALGLPPAIKIMFFPQFRWLKPLGFSNGGYINTHFFHGGWNLREGLAYHDLWKVLLWFYTPSKPTAKASENGWKMKFLSQEIIHVQPEQFHVRRAWARPSQTTQQKGWLTVDVCCVAVFHLLLWREFNNFVPRPAHLWIYAITWSAETPRRVHFLQCCKLHRFIHSLAHDQS